MSFWKGKIIHYYSLSSTLPDISKPEKDKTVKIGQERETPFSKTFIFKYTVMLLWLFYYCVTNHHKTYCSKKQKQKQKLFFLLIILQPGLAQLVLLLVLLVVTHTIAFSWQVGTGLS